MPSLLDFLPRQHAATAYPLARLWGLDRGTDGSGWWAWRCTCGRDVGAERRAAYSGQPAADRMAWWHEHDAEPWAALLSGDGR